MQPGCSEEKGNQENVKYESFQAPHRLDPLSCFPVQLRAAKQPEQSASTAVPRLAAFLRTQKEVVRLVRRCHSCRGRWLQELQELGFSVVGLAC